MFYGLPSTISQRACMFLNIGLRGGLLLTWRNIHVTTSHLPDSGPRGRGVFCNCTSDQDRRGGRTRLSPKSGQSPCLATAMPPQLFLSDHVMDVIITSCSAIQADTVLQAWCMNPDSSRTRDKAKYRHPILQSCCDANQSNRINTKAHVDTSSSETSRLLPCASPIVF